LNHGTGRHSWAGRSESAWVGQHGYDRELAMSALSSGVGREPNGFFQHTNLGYILVFLSTCGPFTCFGVVE
jgi:hypothetical protein